MPQNPGQEFQYTPKKHGDFMVPPGKWQKYSPLLFFGTTSIYHFYKVWNKKTGGVKEIFEITTYQTDCRTTSYYLNDKPGACSSSLSLMRSSDFSATFSGFLMAAERSARSVQQLHWHLLVKRGFFCKVFKYREVCMEIFIYVYTTRNVTWQYIYIHT